MAIGDVFRVQWAFNTEWRQWATSMHYKDVDGIADVDAAEDLLTVVKGIGSSEIAACLSLTTQLSDVYVLKVTGGAGMPARSKYVGVAGSSSPDALPTNKCAVFSLKTVDPLASRMGRLYLSGISKSDTADGAFTAAWVNGVANTLAAKLDDVLTGTLGDWQPVILRTISNGVPISPTPADVSSVSVSGIVYSQRSRQQKYRGESPI